MNYNPQHKPNQLICGTGQTAIATGWTVKEAIAKHLQPEEYAAIGQLYSPTRGISFLIRNLLANPQVRFLVVINATKEDLNAGACECLLDFFRHGAVPGVSDVGRDCWVIKSEVTGYIDREIPFERLEMLRQAIAVSEAKTIAHAIAQTRAIAKLPKREPWGEPLDFPVVESTPTVLPGNRYGHRIEGKTIAETWVKIVHRIKTTGTIRPTGYDGQWQELIDLMAVVTDEPPGFYFPDPNYLPCDRNFINQYSSQFLDDAPTLEGVKYTYGQRLRSWFGRDQIEQVIQKLISEIDAASAVLSLWDVKDHEQGGSPCLNHIWVRVVDNELSLTATFRSNDMFSAWPANAMGLRALQQHIRDQMQARSGHNLCLGPLITISQSAHIYSDCWESADRLIQQQYVKICRQINYRDPVGNFLIEVADDKIIVVLQTTPGNGEVVAKYSGKNPLLLLREICSAVPTIHLAHAGYLGMELQKAYDSIKMGKVYAQDSETEVSRGHPVSSRTAL